MTKSKTQTIDEARSAVANDAETHIARALKHYELQEIDIAQVEALLSQSASLIRIANSLALMTDTLRALSVEYAPGRRALRAITIAPEK